ncbi:MAG: hypothetical protein JNK67_31530 [Alphaproteobacteria bacterium]|nr:hypothetical protein [Alphaproteobacteria bacterium]
MTGRAGLIVVLTLLLMPSLPAQAGYVTYEGDPVDLSFESERVCCVDVAASNMLTYLARHKQGVRDTLKDPKTEQENFHRSYDPEFKNPTRAGSAEAVAGWKKTLADKGLQGDVKRFLTRELSYETLVKEWKDDELIMLNMASADGTIGHSVFLWGLDDDPKSATPTIGVVDPNVHPNTNHGGAGGKGVVTKSALAIGKDDAGLPEWKITVPAGTYEYADGEVFTWKETTYRIVSFVSVSDVGTIPAPPSLPLFAAAGAGLLLWRRRA